jgi:hypothetical protein
MLRRSGRLRILEHVSMVCLCVLCPIRVGSSTFELVRAGVLRSLLGWLEVCHGGVF